MKKLFVLLLSAVLMVMALPAMAQDAPGTIADIVVASASAETPEFSTLLAAVQAGDPAVLEALSNPEAALTVFAPTDAAFAALAEALGAEAFGAVLADPAALTNILLFHVLDGKVMSADVVAGLEANDGMLQVPSLQGQYIDIAQTDDGITVNGANLNLDMVDIEASNGVIHVIDAVILPERRAIAEIAVDPEMVVEVALHRRRLASPAFAGTGELPEGQQFRMEGELGQTIGNRLLVEQRFDVVVAEVGDHRNDFDARLVGSNLELGAHRQV